MLSNRLSVGISVRDNVCELWIDFNDHPYRDVHRECMLHDATSEVMY